METVTGTICRLHRRQVPRSESITVVCTGHIHAMCEDYRAGATIDMAHDEADMRKKIACPLLVLWGAKGAMADIYDVLGIWRERATKAYGQALPGGHNLQEDVPEMVLAEVQGLLKMS